MLNTCMAVVILIMPWAIVMAQSAVILHWMRTFRKWQVAQDEQIAGILRREMNRMNEELDRRLEHHERNST